MKNTTMSIKEWGLLFLLAIIWGASFFFNEIIIREAHPFMLVFLRTALAAVILIIFVYLRGERMPNSLKEWGLYFIMGLINNLIPFNLIVWGQQYIDSGLTSILNATTPLFSALLTHFFVSDEKLTKNRILGLIFGMLGVILLIGPDALKGVTSNVLAQMMILGAALFYAISSIFAKRFNNTSPMISSAGMLTGTAVMMFFLILVSDVPFKFPVLLNSWLAVLGSALLSTATAYSIYFYLVNKTGASNVVLVTFLVPVSSIILGVFFLNEKFDIFMIVGMAMIFSGLIAIDGRIWEKLKKL